MAVGGIFLIPAAIRGPRGLRVWPEPAANNEFTLFDGKSINQNANKPLIFGVF